MVTKETTFNITQTTNSVNAEAQNLLVLVLSYNCNGFKMLYTNSDDLLMKITDNPQHIILITEVIPKAQNKSSGFNVFLNFDPTLHNLGSSNFCGISIYVSNTINTAELPPDIQFKAHLSFY